MKKAITTAVCVLVAMLTLAGCSCSTNSNTTPTESTQQTKATETLDDGKDCSSYKQVKPSKLKDVVDADKVAKLSRIHNGEKIFNSKSDNIAIFKGVINSGKVDSDSGDKAGTINIKTYDKDGKELYSISTRTIVDGVIYIEKDKTYVNFKLDENSGTQLVQLYLSLIE